MSDLQPLLLDYRVAFLRYLPHQDEAALTRGYEIGRAAVADGVSVLHLTHVHHVVLSEVLTDAPADELPRIATAGSEFLMQVLAPFAMTQGRRADGPDASSPSA